MDRNTGRHPDIFRKEEFGSGNLWDKKNQEIGPLHHTITPLFRCHRHRTPFAFSCFFEEMDGYRTLMRTDSVTGRGFLMNIASIDEIVLTLALMCLSECASRRVERTSRGEVGLAAALAGISPQSAPRSSVELQLSAGEALPPRRLGPRHLAPVG